MAEQMKTIFIMMQTSKGVACAQNLIKSENFELICQFNYCLRAEALLKIFSKGLVKQTWVNGGLELTFVDKANNTRSSP